MSKLRIEHVHIDDIKPSYYNPRLDLQPEDEEYQKIKRSIKEFGLVEPIIVNGKTKNIIGGHQRYKVLKELGYEKIPVSVVSLDDEHEKMLNVALNKIEGDWDNTKLKDLLEELDTGLVDVELTGFDMEEIENLMTQFYVEEDESPDAFDEIDLDDVETEYRCPSCGYEWSGGPK